MIIIDQCGYQLVIDRLPRRIISLVPSHTETLVEIAGSAHIVGRTKFCVHPSGIVNDIPKIGGTKNVDIQKVLSLQPDLIIANKEENTKDIIEALKKTQGLVYTSDIKSIADSHTFIFDMGQILDKQERAMQIVSNINKLLPSRIFTPIRALYLIWQRPYMSIGGDTFIHHTMELFGFVNVMANSNRYPEIDIKTHSQECELILLSSEPFPFKKKHLEEISEATGKKCLLVDGEAFSWYGSRLVNGLPYILSLREHIERLKSV